MADIIAFPEPVRNVHAYRTELQTAGQYWTEREKKLLDRIEFYQAMMMVLDDVRLQNASSRDFGMMEVVTEEIPRYHQRLQDVEAELYELRRHYTESQRQAN